MTNILPDPHRLNAASQKIAKCRPITGLVAGFILAAMPAVAQDAATTQPQPPAPTQSEAPAVAAPTVPTTVPAATPDAVTVPGTEAPNTVATAPETGVPVAAQPATVDTQATTPQPATGETLPVADVTPIVEPETEPVPSLFEDPAGAITRMMSPAPRDTTLPHDLSPWGMFMAADIVVKAVMLGLAFASLVTWTVFVAKTFELEAAKRNLRATLRSIQRARTLDEAVAENTGRRGPAALMLRVAQSEAAVSEPALDHAGGDGLKERVSAALSRVEVNAGRKISIGTGVLATIGSTSPFVGLFGTVWGIMNSFIGISKSQTTNLAVVAPGIAEALLATAIGLVAAIPAVIIYNHFARATARYKQILGDASTGAQILVSRDLDFRQIPHTAHVASVRAAAAE